MRHPLDSPLTDVQVFHTGRGSYRARYTSIDQLCAELSDYVWWLDDQRLHFTLGYRSAKEFVEQESSSKDLSNTLLPIQLP